MKPQRFLAHFSVKGSGGSVAQATSLIRQASKLGYRFSFRSEQLSILTGDGTLFAPRTSSGGIIGPVFGLDAMPSGMWGEGPARGDEAIDPVMLTARTWGSYIAVWENGHRGIASVYRDPSGSIPCYYYSPGPGQMLLGSRADHLCKIAGFTPNLDWDVIASFVRNPQRRTVRTAVSGVKELLPGHRLNMPGDEIEEIWSPWHFTGAASRMTDIDDASDKVRQTIDVIMQNWATLVNDVVIGLSGGLDSSIVAVAAARTSLSSTCLTITSGTAIGDERRYARTAASAARLPLIEESLIAEDVDLRRSGAGHCPLPIGRSIVQAIDAVNLRVASDTGATAFLHGGGGDNVFCHLQSIASILDRLYSGHYGRVLLTTLFDTCRAGETDIWSAIALCIRRLASGRRHYRWASDDRFLCDDVSRMRDVAFDHPWLRCPPDTLPGSAAHIASLLAIQNYIEGSSRDLVAPVIAPLLAQPLVELCLRIPSWMWVEGGINRSVARRAFAGNLPDEIVGRRAKGTPDGFAIRIFGTNRAMVREMLCEGQLSQQGIVDRSKILEALTDRGPIRNDDYLRLLALCDVEAWIGSWT